MKFSEYLASFITPQMTLLEKFNALLKYIQEYKKELFLHKIVLRNNSDQSLLRIQFVNTKDKNYTLTELNTALFFTNKLEVKVMEYLVVDSSYQGSNILYYVAPSGILSVRISDYTIESQECKLYEE